MILFFYRSWPQKEKSSKDKADDCYQKENFSFDVPNENWCHKGSNAEESIGEGKPRPDFIFGNLDETDVDSSQSDIMASPKYNKTAKLA